mmetsp:Transcript_1312/g.2493  ORF Transcript_1312/g.2493 Transcript_1312/m.2493 type:complete len:195 (+) Transcript_1312:54-638(+)
MSGESKGGSIDRIRELVNDTESKVLTLYSERTGGATMEESISHLKDRIDEAEKHGKVLVKEACDDLIPSTLKLAGGDFESNLNDAGFRSIDIDNALKSRISSLRRIGMIASGFVDRHVSYDNDGNPFLKDGGAKLNRNDLNPLITICNGSWKATIHRGIGDVGFWPVGFMLLLGGAIFLGCTKLVQGDNTSRDR